MKLMEKVTIEMACSINGLIATEDGNEDFLSYRGWEIMTELLKEYNKDKFHIKHALTVEGVMKYFAEKLGYGEEKEFWGIVGLLHDIDFEMYPDEHCKKVQEIMKEKEIDEKIGWDLDKLIEETILAMRVDEEKINNYVESL